MPIKFASVVATLALLAGASTVVANEGESAGWQRKADNEVANLPSLQRGAKNFMSYCSGCHSLKFVRYSRVCLDLKIADAQCEQFLVRPGDKPTNYIKASMPAADAQEWFGKAPPDLSLEARSRGPDWIFNFLTTFYADPTSRQTGVNNLQLPGTAMPHVLASLQGVQNLKPEGGKSNDQDEKKDAAAAGADHGGSEPPSESGHSGSPFAPGISGSMNSDEYDQFVRDTVNFLQYVGDPTQLERQGLGLWVVLFLLLFTAIAYKLKQEYWKDVR